MVLHGGEDKEYSHEIDGKSCGNSLCLFPNTIMHCDNFNSDIVYPNKTLCVEILASYLETTLINAFRFFVNHGSKTVTNLLSFHLKKQKTFMNEFRFEDENFV